MYGPGRTAEVWAAAEHALNQREWRGAMSNRESLDAKTQASLERGLEQSAAGDVESLGDFSQYVDEDRSAGRWCEHCGQHGSHHTDKHDEYVEYYTK